MDTRDTIVGPISIPLTENASDVDQFMDALRHVTRTKHPRWLQRPTILPDELAHSYALRVLILNAFDSLESIIAAVAENGTIDPKITKLEFLAWIAEVDVSTFLRFHTLTPFQQAFTIGATPRTHGEEQDDNLRYVAFRVKVPYFRVCAACKQEDLGYRGLPILRVSHHIAGVEYCDKHERPLISTGFETDHIPRIKKFSWADVLPETTQGLVQENEVTKRYAAISIALLARSETIPVRHVSDVITSRAKQLGLRRAKLGQRKTLSDLVLEKTPMDWINRLLPCVLKQKTAAGVFTPSLDGVMNPAVICRPEAYVIAMAALYSDADEALLHLATAQMPPESRQTHARHSRPGATKRANAHTATEVAEAYFLSNFSKAAMGRILGRSSIIIDGLFVRFNLPPPRLIGKACNRAALLLFKDGANIKSACASVDASVTDLEDLLRFDLDLLIPLIRRS